MLNFVILRLQEKREGHHRHYRKVQASFWVVGGVVGVGGGFY